MDIGVVASEDDVLERTVSFDQKITVSLLLPVFDERVKISPVFLFELVLIRHEYLPALSEHEIVKDW